MLRSDGRVKSENPTLALRSKTLAGDGRLRLGSSSVNSQGLCPPSSKSIGSF